MKARILRFLVEEMDFDAFAMEATWPEGQPPHHDVGRYPTPVL
jgi:erythromycin esterase-like protein